ncbi:Hypothetical protein R9X50_00591300 [Acrodontium crateriforme]|uniref:Arrestin-like N-terminal domain-containing protein n=1 Tax=Acrodontium crateriforme TaxID=150365 RepID=A0AAQ3M7Y8_9PEZI|nr:Hypothetical protein R9X50_00591300 [Acrodontium crateriforme]
MSTSMPPVVDRSPSTVLSPLSGRRLLSRITSSFASNSRTIADFFIDVDDPHRQYSPGDLVTGSVRLRVVKPVRVTHIVVSLHGFVQVFKNPGSPHDGYRANQNYIGTGRGKQSGAYFGNGFASLFEDEVVLCGDGRLAEGSYQFNFELEFPDRDLPSSIDFERGTISYMITATMTRPIAIAPTVTCDRKVYFVERIDISPLRPPRPRTITLEPVTKRSKVKPQPRRLVVDPAEKSGRKGILDHYGRPNGTSSAPSTQSEPPGSSSPSEISFDSHLSSNGNASRQDASRQSQCTDDRSGTTTSKASTCGRSIHATVESLNGGCLRGDHVGVKVVVEHTKLVRSLYGVIVTLYRQARVDMHPAIPLGPSEKGKESKYEDYYPRSMTGLGGLSLSGAGSSHVFRKDLAQVMAPLYVDPLNYTAEVTAKVRVPEDAFPTISTVPGAMISFKYYAEVVVDIQGKLGSNDRSLGSLSALAAVSSHSQSASQTGGERTVAMPFGSTIIDTAQIRRDKGVITCTFEVVVGTRDSERRKGKKKVEVNVEETEIETQAGAEHHGQSQSAIHWYDEQYAYDDPYYYDQDWQKYAPEGEPPNGESEVLHYVNDVAEQNQQYNMPPPVPIPLVPDESQMSEKERVRQAEMRLLPSQPPGMENGSEMENHAGSSAPYLADIEGESQQFSARPSAPSYTASVTAGSSTSSGAPGGQNTEAHVPSAGQVEAMSPVAESGASEPTQTLADSSIINHSPPAETVPIYETPSNGTYSRAAAAASDDKHQLEQRDLAAEESAPPGMNSGQAGPSTVRPTAPSADQIEGTATQPTEPATLAYDSHADAEGAGLPRYER